MPLPTFLVIGAAKAGTTSLYHYLRQHPQVFMSATKEARYYWSEWRDAPEQPPPAITTFAAYRRLFDGAGEGQAIGEASPQYLTSPTAPGRIAADLPGVRLIVSLRDPVERAYSSYLGRRCGGSEGRAPADALSPGSYYVRTSLYAEALRRYLALFPRPHLKVLLFEDLCGDAAAVMRDLFAFLDIDPDYPPRLDVRHNPAHAPRSVWANRLLMASAAGVRELLPEPWRGTGMARRLQRPLLREPDPLPAALRAELRQAFRDDVLATEALIGRSLQHWL